MKKGDKVLIKYSNKIGLIDSIVRFQSKYTDIDRLIYFVKTPDNELIGSLYKNLKKLNNEEYILETL